jgi:hypothetical protein
VTYGGDSGNRIFVLYWRCSLIRVSVIRGSTVLHICVCVCAWACACASSRLALLIQHVTCMRHLWPLWHHHIFPHYLINGTIFGKSVDECKMCFDFLYNSCLKHFSF